MGWDYTRDASRADIIAALTKETAHECGGILRTLRKCLRGNTMYCLHEDTRQGKTSKFICVYLLQRSKGFGWGYKDIVEWMGPIECDCPLSFLDEADPPQGEYATSWRERVRAAAASRSSKRPKVGETWCLTEGCSPGTVKITSLKPLLGFARGTTFRIRRRQLSALADSGAA